MAEGYIPTSNNGYHEVTLWNAPVGFYTNNNVVSFYATFNGLLDTTHYTGLMPEHLRPDTYVVMPAYSTNDPYEPIGSFWIYADGKTYLYHPAGVTSAYVSGTYIRKTS